MDSVQSFALWLLCVCVRYSLGLCVLWQQLWDSVVCEMPQDSMEIAALAGNDIADVRFTTIELR